jgi:hypothetical protein
MTPEQKLMAYILGVRRGFVGSVAGSDNEDVMKGYEEGRALKKAAYVHAVFLYGTELSPLRSCMDAIPPEMLEQDNHEDIP